MPNNESICVTEVLALSDLIRATYRSHPITWEHDGQWVRGVPICLLKGEMQAKWETDDVRDCAMQIRVLREPQADEASETGDADGKVMLPLLQAARMLGGQLHIEEPDPDSDDPLS